MTTYQKILSNHLLVEMKGRGEVMEMHDFDTRYNYKKWLLGRIINTTIQDLFMVNVYYKKHKCMGEVYS